MLPENHAIAILKKDHDTVKGLFEEFEKAQAQFTWRAVKHGEEGIIVWLSRQKQSLQGYEGAQGRAP